MPIEVSRDAANPPRPSREPLQLRDDVALRLATSSDGVWITVQVVTISVTLGFLLAYPICLARMSRRRILSGAAVSYVTFFRGTPLLCQLYLVYYGAGEIRPFLTDTGLWWLFREAFVCCIFAFSLNTAAYQSEIMRGALASVGKGPDRGGRLARPCRNIGSRATSSGRRPSSWPCVPSATN